MVNLAPWAAPLFIPHRYKVLYGGRSSGKTEQAAASLVIQGHQQPLTMAIVREHLESIRKSAKPALEGWIRRLGLERPDAYRITNDGIYHANGTWMFFAGMSKVSLETVCITWFTPCGETSAASSVFARPIPGKGDGMETQIDRLPFEEYAKTMAEKGAKEHVNLNTPKLTFDELVASELTANEIEAQYGEETAINVGIARDPDAPELDDEWFARARPAIEVHPELVEYSLRKRGKQKAPIKERVTL